jgi:hypothetical protein
MSGAGEAVDRERLRALAALGAQRAATVLAGFAGSPVEARGLRDAGPPKAPPFETGIDFGVDGDLCARLTLYLDVASRRALVRLLLDEEESEVPQELLASALCELANIVASQAVSAIADELGGRVALSVPRLELELAASKLSAAHALVFTSELVAPGAELRVLLVFAPAV